MSAVDRIVVCICGGGNGAHVMAGTAAVHAQTETRVLTLFQDEAERWSKKMQESDFTITKRKDNDEKEVINVKADQLFITNDASKAVTGADIIIFCVPAFAHGSYFKAIAPYVQSNTAIIALPGQPGVQFQCVGILGEKSKKISILDYESLPWACRLSEFGRNVDVLATKDFLFGSWIKRDSCPKVDPNSFLQSMLGKHPVLKLANNYLEILLQTVVHPPIMMATWKDWDGKPVSEAPLFYQGMSEEGCAMLWQLSEETMDCAKAINKVRPDIKLDNVTNIETWMRDIYKHAIKDKTSFYTVMKTNTAYDGLVHPMKEVSPGQFVPDFKHRYMTEDVPYGLAVTKGVAQILSVPTPVTDSVIHWAQGLLGKEYLVGSELKGKDVGETRAPQAFGMHKLEDLLALL